MNCGAVCESLSAYYDDELDESLAAQVREHLANCESCRSECRCFESLSALAAETRGAAGSPPAWASVLIRLDSFAEKGEALQVVRDSASKSTWQTATAAALSIAASLLFIAVIWFADGSSHHGQPHQHTASAVSLDLGAVIERFAYGPDAAVELLSRQSGAREVGPSPAASGAMVALASLPGVRPLSTRVLQFPQCTCGPGECSCDAGGCGCVASVFERDDRSSYLVLEQCKSHPVSFGSLQRQKVEKSGLDVEQVRSRYMLAVSWEDDGRRYTAIGLTGEGEADQVITAVSTKL